MSEQSLEQFLALEERVWTALVHGDADADLASLADDFLGVYPTGFADRAAHAAPLRDGPLMASYSLSEARLLPLAADLVMLAYRADFRRWTGSAPGEPAAMYISSLWVRRAGEWVNVFSQDTPLAPGAAPSG